MPRNYLTAYFHPKRLLGNCHTGLLSVSWRQNSQFALTKNGVESVDDEVQALTSKYIVPNEPFIKPISSAYLRTHMRIPIVLLIGNHSSGKSSFINSLLGTPAQETGVAPTDDGFTAILRGSADITEDGLTAVSNPNYGFEELRMFGDTFLSHFKVKTKKLESGPGIIPNNIMLIDSPGMIDTPLSTKVEDTKKNSQLYDRGYDFPGVVRWLGKRCDLILLLFDPSNPGTTGETLDILTHSLDGVEHKFIILFNKIDMFNRMNDFARCYGTLCWNLAKVLHNKDLPRIYITYTKLAPVDQKISSSSIQSSRDEIVKEIFGAPLRRIDNLLSELDSSARSLYLLCFVINKLKRQYLSNWMLRASYLTVMLLLSLSIGAFPLTYTEISAKKLAFFLCGSSLSALLGVVAYQASAKNWKPDIQTIEADIQKQKFFEKIPEWPTVWLKLKPNLIRELKSDYRNISKIPSPKRASLQELRWLIEGGVPQLRKKVHSLKHVPSGDTKTQQNTKEHNDDV
ncbi:hypothetical protein XU18_0301 [Perkinsela sp. CCAP 1560/4]|nr:hypothetical protein XU18_0301 [Perkinsela sp. CCAP 1560/4]|eukprot:KNH09616.1 hypothetical protein XU18_0301 [Perkinsela sp. CCAP 1560/4]